MKTQSEAPTNEATSALEAILALVREWREHLASRDHLLASANEQQVLRALTLEGSLPARARRLLLELVEERSREAQDRLLALEREREELLAKRAPLEAQLKYYIRLLEPIDEALAPLNERIFIANGDVASHRTLAARFEKAQIRTMRDLEEALRLLGVTMEVEND